MLGLLVHTIVLAEIVILIEILFIIIAEDLTIPIQLILPIEPDHNLQHDLVEILLQEAEVLLPEAQVAAQGLVEVQEVQEAEEGNLKKHFDD